MIENVKCPDCGVDITLLLIHLRRDLAAIGCGGGCLGDPYSGWFELGPRCIPCEKALGLWIHIFWKFNDTRECLPGVH